MSKAGMSTILWSKVNHSRMIEIDYSPFGMMKFYTSTTLHLISKLSQFGSLCSITWSKMTLLPSSIFWVRLSAKTGSSIIGLVSVWPSFVIVSSSSFGKGPSREVCMRWSMSGSFWNISSWTNTIWCRNQIFQSLSSPKTKGILLRSVVNWLFNWLILWTRICFRRAPLESWFSSNLRS